MKHVLRKTLIATAVLCGTAANAAVIDLFADPTKWSDSGTLVTVDSDGIVFNGTGSAWRAIDAGELGGYQFSFAGFHNNGNARLRVTLGGTTLFDQTAPKFAINFSNPYTFDFDTAGTLTFALTAATATSVSYAVQQVPGPLPVIGALAAFGWSRKLRRKIADAEAKPATA